MQFRFPKSARLTRSSEFQKVKSQGKSCNGKFIILSVLENLDSDDTRIGVITSGRLGNAVKRNKVRRRLRELVRLTWPRLRKGVWIVLIARKHAVSASYKSLEKEWLRMAEYNSILI